MNLFRPTLLACGLLAFTACESIFASTPHPDYAIRVATTPQGKVAVPPECPSWTTESANPFDNQPIPQFGCATARNLASAIDQPNDLIEGRTLGPARGVLSVGTIRRYDNNQPRGLVMPAADTSQPAGTTAPTGASSMTGDITAGGSSAAGGATAP